MSETNVDEFIEELGAGVFKAKLAKILSDAALATVLYGIGNKKGKVSIEFTFQQIGENEQVVVSHKLCSSLPTKRGKKSEEDITDTPMFVGKGGVMTIGPPEEDDHGQFGLDGQSSVHRINK